MLEILEDYPNIKMVIDNLNNIVLKLTSRIKFIVLNFIDSYDKKKVAKEQLIINEKETKNSILLKNSVDTYNNLIMEYIINSSHEDFFNAIKKKVDGELVLAILRKYNPRSEDKIVNLINKLMEKNILTTKIIHEKIELYQNNGEIEDIMEECPIITKFVEKLKTF